MSVLMLIFLLLVTAVYADRHDPPEEAMPRRSGRPDRATAVLPCGPGASC